MTFLKPKKNLGQNFLKDEKVVADLVATAKLTNDDVVLEPGAGTGALTKELAKRSGKVIAVELDPDLIPILRENLKGFPNVEIIHSDSLRIRNNELGIKNPWKVVGSIPYQITSPLIHKFLTEEPQPTLIVLLIQKEVAEKIAAKAPKASYLSNFVKAFADVETIRTVPPSAFRPAPKVQSAIVRLNPKPYTLDPKSFSHFLHRGFSSPRKMLNKVFPKELLEKVGIDDTRRAETLTLGEWESLYREWLNG